MLGAGLGVPGAEEPPPGEVSAQEEPSSEELPVPEPAPDGGAELPPLDAPPPGDEMLPPIGE